MRRSVGWALLIGWLLSCVFARTAQAVGSGEALYRFAPAAAWIKDATPEYGAKLPAGGVADGAWDLLLDRQTRLNPDGDDFYQHSAVLVTNASGVDDRSQISIEVDPSFETLTLHNLRVVRQGHVIDEKPLARITAVPRESQLSERIYNGTYNIDILLFDVRSGDVVEYDYTLHSVERLFPGVFAQRLTIGWSVPMHWERVRILAPESRPLYYRTEDGSTPTIATQAAVRELSWEWHDRTPIPGDDDRPKWYSTWPHLEVTSCKTWAEVVRRIAPLFDARPTLDPALLRVIAQIRQGGGSPTDQALRALQFVQEQVRYVSISIGPGRFKPSPPQTVLERRFGDCKDKSLLLATVLHELGIDARVALVNSRSGRVLNSWLPTPYAFDHAIVRARIGDQVYWLDGTADTQYSALSSHAPADFERALVADRATTELESIPRPSVGSSGKASMVLVDLSAGNTKPARLQITTIYHGKMADRVRQDLADETPAKRESRYLNYILRYYPGAKTAAPIEIRDDLNTDVLETLEIYSIESPFKKQSNGHLQFFLQADEIYRYLNQLDSTVRKAPLEIAYPLSIRQTVRALLPHKMAISDETVRIDNAAFRYQSVLTYSEEGSAPLVTLDYSYNSLTDFVNVADLPEYQADRSRAYDDAGYSIRLNPTAVLKSINPFKPTTVAAWLAWLAVLIAAWFVSRFLVRWDPPPRPAELSWPVGIRGWLLVAAVSVVSAPIGACVHVRNLDLSVFDASNWTGLHDSVPAPWKESARFIMLALVLSGMCLVIVHFGMAWLFFSRRSSAPQAFIVIHWIALFYSGLAHAIGLAFHVAGAIGEAAWTFELLGGVAGAGGFTLYFLRSKRVKATFVRRYNRKIVAVKALASPA